MLKTLQTVSKITFSLFQKRDNVSSGSSVNNSGGEGLAVQLCPLYAQPDKVCCDFYCAVNVKKQKTLLLTF